MKLTESETKFALLLSLEFQSKIFGEKAESNWSTKNYFLTFLQGSIANEGSPGVTAKRAHTMKLTES